MKSSYVKVLLLVLMAGVVTFLGFYHPQISVSPQYYIGFFVLFGFMLFSSYLFGTEDVPNEVEELYKDLTTKKIRKDLVLWPIVSLIIFFLYGYVRFKFPLEFSIKYGLVGALQMFIIMLHYYEVKYPGFTVHRLFNKPVEA